MHLAKTSHHLPISECLDISRLVDSHRKSTSLGVGISLEVRALLRPWHSSQVDHPGCIRLHDVFEDHKMVYLVEDIAAGGELFDRIVEMGYFSEKNASQYVKQIFLAISYLHGTPFPPNIRGSTPAPRNQAMRLSASVSGPHPPAAAKFSLEAAWFVLVFSRGCLGNLKCPFAARSSACFRGATMPPSPTIRDGGAECASRPQTWASHIETSSRRMSC